jgi:hypothetical protein
VKHDFSFSFLSATEDLGFACYTGNTLNKQDDNELEEIKANKVIEDNQEKFSKIKGFDGLEVDYKETYNGGKRPIVLINLSSKHPSHENLPEEMCNFELKLNYDF